MRHVYISTNITKESCISRARDSLLIIMSVVSAILKINSEKCAAFYLVSQMARAELCLYVRICVAHPPRYIYIRKKSICITLAVSLLDYTLIFAQETEKSTTMAVSVHFFRNILQQYSNKTSNAVAVLAIC